MIAALAAIALAFALGAALVWAAWPWRLEGGANWLTAMALALGMGFGVSGVIFFATMLIFGAPTTLTFLLEIIAAFAVIVVGGARRRSIPSYGFGLGFDRVAPPPRPFLQAACFLIAVAAIVGFILISVRLPHGDWDAWSVWNIRARFIAGLGENWRNAFAAELSHSNPSYPPLLPSMVARWWVVAGTRTTLAPIFIAFSMMVSLSALLYGSLAHLRDSTAAAIGATALLGTPYFVWLSASQYADVPLAFFYLATAALLTLCLRSGHASFAALAGFAASLAAMTKNEGMLFFLVAGFVCCVVAISRGLTAEALKIVAGFALAALPVMLLVMYFKTRIAPETYLLSGPDSGSALSKVFNLERYAEIFRAFDYQRTLLGLRGWGLFPIVLPIFLLIARGRGVQRRWESFPAFAIVALMFAGYVSVYLLTPYDLAWHLSTSLGRLLFHLWPMTIFALVLAFSPRANFSARG